MPTITKKTSGFYFKTCLRHMTVSTFSCLLEHWNSFAFLLISFVLFLKCLAIITIKYLHYSVILTLIEWYRVLIKEKSSLHYYDAFTTIRYCVIFKTHHMDTL